MGVSESRIIAETVLSSCQMAETEGKTVLDERSLWKDKVWPYSVLTPSLLSGNIWWFI